MIILGIASGGKLVYEWLINVLGDMAHSPTPLIWIGTTGVIQKAVPVFRGRHTGQEDYWPLDEHTADKVGEMIEVFHGMFRRLDRLDTPTLAIVQGAALGGGCEVALFCDMVLASDKAKFGQPEIKVGVLPPIAAVMLPRLVPNKKALELLLIGDTIDAAEAHRLGLVNQVVPVDQLPAAAGEMIGKFTSLSGVVLRMTRRAARLGGQGAFGEALNQVESLYLSELIKTHDANEGLNAFLEKRLPVWKDQ